MADILKTIKQLLPDYDAENIQEALTMAQECFPTMSEADLIVVVKLMIDYADLRFDDYQASGYND